MMFGPKDSESTNNDQSIRWKIKRKTNEATLKQPVAQSTMRMKETGCSPLLPLARNPEQMASEDPMIAMHDPAMATG